MANLNSIGGIHYEMMRRCYNQNSIAYKSYGGKGIRVYEPWHNRDVFRAWAVENGYIKGLRLCRRDSSKDYTPENCFFGESKKAKHGKAEQIRKHIKEYKEKKSAIGLKRITDSPLLKTYYGMHTRCENPNHKHFKHYGGRGISVCPEWSGKDGVYAFLAWARTSGWIPGLTLDRIDVNGNYEPENCRWVTQKEQIRNRRNTKLYNHRGLSMTIFEIACMENISDSKLRNLLKKGMSLDEAIKICKTNPPHKKDVMMLTYNGISKPITEWSKENGISASLLRSRINAGFPESELFLPPNKTSRKQGRRK